MKMLEPLYIVDDESDIVRVFREIAIPVGCEIRTFASAKEALEACHREAPFLVVSDFKMPELNGLEFCQRFREMHPLVPFVLITGYADKEVAIKGLGSGLTDLLEKPIDNEVFRQMVQRHYQQRSEAIDREQKENEEVIALFIEEANDLFADLDQLIMRLEGGVIDEMVVDSLFRKVHSVKGGAGAIPGGGPLANIGHEFESVLALIKRKELRPNEDEINLFLACADACRRLIRLIQTKEAVSAELGAEVEVLKASLIAMKSRKPGEAPAPGKVAKVSVQVTEDSSNSDEGIMVSSERLDDFMNLSGELIVLKNYFYMISRDGDLSDELYEKRMQEFGQSLNKITDNLQDQIAAIRKVTLEKAFGKLPRIARKTAQDVDKKVSLEMHGLDQGVDKNIAKSLGTCMTHMIRNSIDHGIEKPEVRVAAGKAPEGKVEVRAQENQGIIQVVVRDDGGGISRDRVVAKAVQNGLVSEAAAKAMSDTEVFDMIFLPGFSTAEKVTGTSGRGVGMDVVKSEILSHNGRVRIDSKLGQGTTFVIEIPVMKAVMVEQTILTKFKEAIFAIPLVSISRIVSMDQLQIVTMGHHRTCQFEGATVQVRSYEEYLLKRDVLSEEDLKRRSVVFMTHKNQSFGMVVDQIQDQLEAVIRPFDSIVKEMPGFKGTTVLGNERIAYIVSPEHMYSLVQVTEQESA